MSLPEPPTAATIASARQVLHSTQSELSALQSRLQDAEAKLAKIVAESKCAINEMQQEQSVLEDKIAHTLAYVSPIRRLPQELLRQIFLINFEDFPCCAWVLAAVCSPWRRLALNMPRIWSRVSLPYLLALCGGTYRAFLVVNSDALRPYLSVTAHRARQRTHKGCSTDSFNHCPEASGKEHPPCSGTPFPKSDPAMV